MNGQVSLKWSTNNEVNNKQFIVERSAEGRIFTPVLQVPSQVGSSPVTNYNAIDGNPLKGISYYRLKQVDNDGRSGYSAIARVHLFESGKMGFDIYPNPISGKKISIVFEEAVQGKATIRIFDLNGRMQLNTQQTVSSNNVTLDHKLSPGVYVVSVTINNKEQTRKIVVE
jgi:hypothetical protein